MRKTVQPAWGSRISGTVTAPGVQEQSCLILTSDILLHRFTYQKHEKKDLLAALNKIFIRCSSEVSKPVWSESLSVGHNPFQAHPSQFARGDQCKMCFTEHI